MKTVLTDLDVLVATGYLSIDSICYESRSNLCTVIASDARHSYRIIFDDAIAFRMMDERELGEFYSGSIEEAHHIDGAAISKVESGGWQGTDEHISSSLQDGFFNRTPVNVAEYIMATDYECLNIISLAPTVTVIEKMTSSA